MGAPPPDPRAYNGWRRWSPTSSFRQIGDVLQIPETPSPHCTFLAARLNLIMFLHF